MHDTQIKRLKKYRTRKLFSILGIIWNGHDWYITGKFLGYVTVIEEKFKARKTCLNELSLGDWKYFWKVIKIEE
ncbi:MAG TPA: hypothetical protein VLA48_02510 [Nitrososphaeraceae archaeon]|nr:hypothetical protein [Nitrososphaeraceae archaeon]